jgi:Bacterial pre-peptidase C-terminal domain
MPILGVGSEPGPTGGFVAGGGRMNRVFLSGLCALLVASAVRAHLEPVREVEPNDTAATATPLTTATTCFVALGAISRAADADHFSFEAPAGARLWAVLDTGRSTASRDSVLTLIGPNGTTQIEKDDNGALGSGCDISVESQSASGIAGTALRTRGTYFLRVQASDAASRITSYILFVVITSNSSAEAEPNDVAAKATAIVTSDSPIGVRRGSIRGGDLDFYAAHAMTVGLVLQVSVVADSAPPAATRLGVDLMRSDGFVLTSAESEGAGPKLRKAVSFCFILNDGGNYFVRVRGLPSARSSPGAGYTLLVAACGVHDTAGMAATTVTSPPARKPAIRRTAKPGAP